MKTQNIMKNDFQHFLDSIGLAWNYAVNGLIGGAIWSLYKKSNFLEALRQIIIGAAVAGYLTPVIVSKASMNVETVGATSFVVGMMGMVIIDSIYKYVAKNIKKYAEAVKIMNRKK
jgi:uncharacterized membrane protein YeaQ/YmgE (transglycosylase-associated protein family)